MLSKRLNEVLNALKDLEPKSFSNISQSLLSSSNRLEDLHITTYQYSNEESQKISSLFLLKIHNFKNNLRKGYKFTWNLLLESNYFMEKGSYTLNQVNKHAPKNPQLATAFLIKIISDIQMLLKSHIQADERLEMIHINLTKLIEEAKLKSSDSLKKIEILQNGLSLKDKILCYGGSFFVCTMTRNIFFGITAMTTTGFWQWRNIDQNKINSKQYILIVKNFLESYKVLNNTRLQIQKDIAILSNIRKSLEIIILYIEDIGLILNEEHFVEFSELVTFTKKKFKELHNQYQKILNFPTRTHNPFCIAKK